MTNQTTAGPGDPPAKLLKRIIDGDQTLLRRSHGSVFGTWQTGEVPKWWEGRQEQGTAEYEEGKDGLRQLRRHLPRGACW